MEQTMSYVIPDRIKKNVATMALSQLAGDELVVETGQWYIEDPSIAAIASIQMQQKRSIPRPQEN